MERHTESRESGGSEYKQKVVLYDYVVKASFTYNAKTGTYWWLFVLPEGAEADKAKAKASRDGNYSVPTMNAKDAVAKTGFLQVRLRNSYEKWVDEQARSNRHVYVASKRFVDTVSLGKLAQEVAWAIVTYGNTAQGSADALKELLLLEWSDILNWLKEVGIEDSERAASNIVKAILDNGLKPGSFDVKLGSAVRIPEITVKVEQLNYEYDINLAVTDQELSRSLSLIGYDSNKPIAKLGEVPEPHLAFSFSITTQSAPNYKKLFSKFLDLLQKGPLGGQMVDAVVLDKVVDLLGIDSGKAKDFRDGDGSERAAYTRALPKLVSDGLKYHTGNGVFDFTRSEGAIRFENNLRELMIGNKKKATVTKLEVDVVSASLTLEVDLESKEEMEVKDILGALKAPWIGKQENRLYDDAKEACEALGETCRKLLPQVLRIARKLCGVATTYKAVAPQELPNPVEARFANLQEILGGEADSGEDNHGGLKLPIWCIDDSWGAFEVRRSNSSRQSARTSPLIVQGTEFSGTARRNPGGSLRIGGQWNSARGASPDWPYTAVVGADGHLQVNWTDPGPFKLGVVTVSKGRCRSVI